MDNQRKVIHRSSDAHNFLRALQQRQSKTHWQPVVINVQYLIQIEGHWDPCNRVGPKVCLRESLGFKPKTF